MYVKRVVLEDLRGFKRADLEMKRPDGKYSGWWVITGDNGSGKTALLKAIAMALVGPDAIRALEPSFQGWIRQGESKAKVKVEIVAGERDRFAVGRRPERPFWSELNLSAGSGPEIELSVGNTHGKEKKSPINGPWAANPSGWFCSGYGPFRRLYGASPDAQRVMSGPGRVARFATMFREDATLGECELWLKELHHKKLEGHQVEAQILESVRTLLDDDFLENGLRIERVDSAGLWIRQSNDAVLPLSDMSEGYRAALAMLIDLLRHMVQVHGHESFVQTKDGRPFVPHMGVVLIDEVDAHLHPEWQRRIGFWLKDKLPNVQFIVTTHSAMICQAADQDGIFYLPPPGSDEYPERISGLDYLHIIKGKPDEILRGRAFRLVNTRSERVVAARREYSKLQSKAHSVGLTKPEENYLKGIEWAVGSDENGD
jgi:predicted ATPase